MLGWKKSALAQAPEGLQAVRSFANTLDIDEDVDHLATIDGLVAWMAEQGHFVDSVEVTPAGLERARAVRDALRGAMEANADHADRDAALRELNDLARGLPLRVRFVDDDTAELVPVGAAVDGVLASLLADVRDAMRDGTWRRLKICRSEDCQWAYYDASRNRSGRWCSMAVCGNRQKVRAYRERQSADEVS